MPRTARSPPKAAPKKVSADPEATKNKTPENISQAAKRPRAECSPGNEFLQLKEEIKQMLADWKLEQDSALTKLISEMSDLKAQNFQLQKSFLDVEKSMEFMSSKYEDFSNKMKDISKERDELRSYVLSLESRIQDIQSVSRSSSVEIRNIPNNDKETQQDLISIVCGIGKTLNVDVSPGEIRDIYRGPGKPEKNRALAVEFHSVLKKKHFLAAVREFNRGKPMPEKLNSSHYGRSGQSIPIYIDEHLPYSAKKLFYEARNYAKQHNFKYCWTNDGKIFLRKDNGQKAINIKSAKCLQSLVPSSQ